MPNSSRAKAATPVSEGEHALAIEADEMLRVAVSDGQKIDRGTALHQRLSSRPIS